jgi:hypothetical protein
MSGLPFSQACENNKLPILSVLQPLFAGRRAVLEIGAGTGQHATFFATHLPWLHWYPSELPANLPYLLPRCEQYPRENLAPPQALDVTERPWPLAIPDALFTANTFHIMPWEAVVALFAELRQGAAPDTLLAVYGPFNYGGRYTSESNARFDQWLAQRDPDSAIRDFEAVDALASGAGFALLEDHAMPANNRLLAWHRA